MGDHFPPPPGSFILLVAAESAAVLVASPPMELGCRPFQRDWGPEPGKFRAKYVAEEIVGQACLCLWSPT